MATDPGASPVPLAEGVEHDLAEWEKATAAVLRKTKRLADDAPDTDVWGALTRDTLDGIGISPLGTAALTADLPDPGLPGQAPFTRGSTAVRELGAWEVRAHVAHPDPSVAAEQVLADLEGGVNSVWLQVGDDAVAVDALPTVLAEVFVDLAPVVLDAPHDGLAAARALADVVDAKGVDRAPGTSLGLDPVGRRLRGHGDTSFDDLQAVAEIAVPLRAHAVTVDGTAVHDAGGSEVQELAYLLAAGVEYLRRLEALGYGVDEAAGLLEFRLAATDEQFTTIAKLRAARRLWSRVAELSGVEAGARGMVQHAVTSRPMMTRYDPWVNMLRTTVATFAAGVGGASSVTTLPFDEALGLPEPFGRRIARNTSALLISESHVAAVTDPAGGAHAVEKLTDDLARAAWALLGEIEQGGGVLAVIDDGSLAGRIAQTVSDRALQIARRERPVTGVSEFPNLHEELPVREPAAGPAVHRYAHEFEEMRDARAARPVFLATMGSIASHTARATFAANLFAAGGIDTVTAGATDGVDDVVAAYREAGTPAVVCLAGHDRTYDAWGADLVPALREAGATHVVLAGKGDLPVDATVAVGLDALAFLRSVRTELEADA